MSIGLKVKKKKTVCHWDAKSTTMPTTWVQNKRTICYWWVVKRIQLIVICTCIYQKCTHIHRSELETSKSTLVTCKDILQSFEEKIFFLI